MKTSVIVSICLAVIVTTFSENVSARENSKTTVNKPVENRELRLDEIIACGYAYAFLTSNTGDEYLCYGEINKMDFRDKTSCHRVKATIDEETGRPKEVIYLNK